MQLLQVEKQDRSHATTNKIEVTMGGKEETKDVVKNESKKEDHQPQTPVQSPQSPSTPQTYELKKHGYLALARGLGSGVYETGLSSQVSGGIEIFGFQNRDIVGSYGDDFGSLRQSSIDTEPHTLGTITVRHAKDGAVEIIKTYDEEDALHLFLKDAEDEHLREEAMAAILPVAPELVT